MDSGLVVMSRREIERAHVMRAVQERRLTQKQAASQLALSVRQVERLFARYKRDGPTGLVSRRRGQRNHVSPDGLREEALSIVRTRCSDFGPTLAHEKLRRELGLNGTVFVYVGKAGGWYDVEGMVDFLAAARAVFRPLTLLVLTTEDPSVFSELCEAAGIELIIRRAEPHEVPDYLSAADVGLCFRHRFPSQLSCSPIKLAEYLACGLPVVATSGCGDYDELIEAEDVGVVIQNGDEETVVAAAHELQALLREPTIGQRCRSTAERFLGLEEVVVPRYSEIYQCLCST